MISCVIKYILRKEFLDMMFDCETRLSAGRNFSLEKLGLHVKMIWVNLD